MALRYYLNEPAREALAGTLAWIPWIVVPRGVVAVLMSVLSSCDVGVHGGIFPGLPWPTAAGAFFACWWFIVESAATFSRAAKLAENVRSGEHVSPDALSSSRRERYRWAVFFELLALIATFVGPLAAFPDGPHPNRVPIFVFWLAMGLGVRLCRTRLLIKDGIVD